MAKFGTSLIKAAKEARAIARGEITDGFVAHVPDDIDVKALRKKTEMLAIRIFPAIRTRHRRGAGLGATSQNARPNRTHLSYGDRPRAEGGPARARAMNR